MNQINAPLPLQTIGELQTIPPKPDEPTLSTSEPLEPGTLVADRFRIERTIGIGGMGIVYLADDQIAERPVAIKLIHPKFASNDRVKARLKQEGLVARDIRHKNVVAVYDIGEFEGHPFVAMEYLEGVSLRTWLREQQLAGQSVNMDTAYQIVAQILEGLRAAHEAGIVHRDLKPENVMLEQGVAGLTVKILDFGIALNLADVPQSNHAVGTRGYMAPEQLTNSDGAGPVADLYAVSVMFYELLVDVLPQGHWQPPSGGRSDIPRGIDRLIEKGLSNRPANRWKSAAEYLEALNAAMQSAPALTFGGESPLKQMGMTWLERSKQNLSDLQTVVGLKKTEEPLPVGRKMNAIGAIIAIVFFAILLASVPYMDSDFDNSEDNNQPPHPQMYHDFQAPGPSGFSTGF